ncbi:MAG: haloacid dehalogenase-like hydrolase [Verrucomicrobiales bacterium]|jgi:phosphoglycolate phosphatase-like HAD superfamily hydrolase|nr:haloacid dehalogenase-like hydrolase [Verrucomicrobiales bacterium]
MKKYLLLWDIDGTLVTTGKAGEIAMAQSTERAFGIKSDLSKVDFRGRTDTWIGMQLFKQLGLEPTPEHLHEFHEAYLSCLKEQLPLNHGKIFPGILEILEQAANRENCVNALLTGNLARGAELKLSHYSVWHYFEFGAFSDDSPVRNELGPVALKRALEKTGQPFSPENVYIIGDTPHDIACGKAIGAKTISVATGGYSKEELLGHEPTAYFDDFSHPEKFFELLGR